MDFDINSVMDSIDGSIAAMIVLGMGWALFTDRIFLKREVDAYRERSAEEKLATKVEAEGRIASEKLVHDLTNELREHNRTNDKVIDVLLASKGNSNGSNQEK